MNPKQVRGLLDMADLTDDSGETALPTPGFVPGLGLGTSEEARRWAYLGYQMEISKTVNRANAIEKKKRGRPEKPTGLLMPQKRAFHMWLELRNLPEAVRVNSTNRKLIEWMIARQDLLPSMKKLWGASVGLEKSLSAGKKYWEMKGRLDKREVRGSAARCPIKLNEINVPIGNKFGSFNV